MTATNGQMAGTTGAGRGFPCARLAGTHREIGRQFGEAFTELIRRHRDLALDRLQARAGVDVQTAVGAALRYRPYVIRHAGFLDDEIQGVAEAAGLSLAEAYLLQLRAELATPVIGEAGVAPSREPALAGETGDECTTFASVIAEPSLGRMRVAVGPPNLHPYQLHAFSG